MSSYAEPLKKGAARNEALLCYLSERIRSQISFAESLCELHPEKAGTWRPLIARAAAAIERATGKGETSLRDGVREAEILLGPIGKTAEQYTVYLVGHAHIDMNWMWSWPETVAVTNDTFTTVLRLMDEYPEFHFSQSQACAIPGRILTASFRRQPLLRARKK